MAEDWIKDDITMFGVAYVLVAPDGTRTRVDPTDLLVITREEDPA